MKTAIIILSVLVVLLTAALVFVLVRAKNRKALCESHQEPADRIGYIAMYAKSEISASVKVTDNGKNPYPIGRKRLASAIGYKVIDALKEGIEHEQEGDIHIYSLAFNCDLFKMKEQE